MKRLMLGNEAVARGLYEAGCRVVSSYPGTPSTEISEYAAKYEEIYAEWAPNEKVAAEVAIGASFGGARIFLRDEACGTECGGGSGIYFQLYRSKRRHDSCRGRRPRDAFFAKRTGFTALCRRREITNDRAF